MQFITIKDFILLPFYLFAIYMVAFRLKDYLYPEGHPWRSFFIPALTIKIVGAIFIGFIYQYYYGSGDTAFYYQQAKLINSSFSDSPTTWLKLLLNIPKWYDGAYIEYTSKLIWYQAPSTYMVCGITALINVLTFNTYLPTSVIFATISFSGIWALFRTFATQYPKIVPAVALVTLYVPSVAIWGSGIFKDTLCIFGIGWMIYSVFTTIILRQIRFLPIFMGLLGFYLVATIKIYIVIAFLPALIVWINIRYTHIISNIFVRRLTSILLLGISVLIIVFALQSFNQLGEYSLDNLINTSTTTRDYIYRSSGDEGSVYTLGDIEPTPLGILKKAPLAVNVTLFRPYIWEANKSIIFLNALESFLFLIITLRVIILLGPLRTLREISKNPDIQFCLLFTLIFAFAIGISTYNFGSLSRYKIPCLPIYGLTLILLYYSKFPPTKRFL